jgi:hypothetical protein
VIFLGGAGHVRGAARALALHTGKCGFAARLVQQQLDRAANPAAPRVITIVTQPPGLRGRVLRFLRRNLFDYEFFLLDGSNEVAGRARVSPP